MLLKAIRIVDLKGRRTMTAYGVRGANRARLWTADITGLDRAGVQAAMDSKETDRRVIEVFPSGTARIKGGYGDN